MRKAADTEAIWVIRDGSQMVMLGEGTAKQLIPVWPEKAFAEHHLTGTWAGYHVEEMAVDDFLDWLDQLQKEGVGIAAFPKEDLQGVVVEAQEMQAHLLHELQQYE